MFLSIEEILSRRLQATKEEFFAPGIMQQKNREAWCVAKMCMYIGVEGQLRLENDEPTDVLLKTSADQYFIQVTEIKELGKRFRWSPEFSVEEICQFVDERINKKTTYDYQSMNEMTLLLYMNIGNGEGKEEFWFETLNSLEFGKYPFKNIVILDSDYGVAIKKGEIL